MDFPDEVLDELELERVLATEDLDEVSQERRLEIIQAISARDSRRAEQQLRKQRARKTGKHGKGRNSAAPKKKACNIGLQAGRLNIHPQPNENTGYTSPEENTMNNAFNTAKDATVNAAAATGNWITNNPVKTAAIGAGVVAAGAAGYYLMSGNNSATVAEVPSVEIAAEVAEVAGDAVVAAFDGAGELFSSAGDKLAAAGEWLTGTTAGKVTLGVAATAAVAGLGYWGYRKYTGRAQAAADKAEAEINATATAEGTAAMAEALAKAA